MSAWNGHTDADNEIRAAREKALSSKFANKEYRAAYVKGHGSIFLASQIQALRGDLTQEEFGNKLGMPQTVISRLENSNYGKHSLATLFKIAEACDVALLIRFVDHQTFIKSTEDFSAKAFCPDAYEAPSKPQEGGAQ